MQRLPKKILKGEERGPKRQAVCLNAGAALYIAGKAESIEKGVRMAEELIDSGAALKKIRGVHHLLQCLSVIIKKSVY